jgi:hypothetical protein
LTEIENEFKKNSTQWIEKFPGPEVIRRAREWASAGGVF